MSARTDAASRSGFPAISPVGRTPNSSCLVLDRRGHFGAQGGRGSAAPERRAFPARDEGRQRRPVGLAHRREYDLSLAALEIDARLRRGRNPGHSRILGAAAGAGDGGEAQHADRRTRIRRQGHLRSRVQAPAQGRPLGRRAFARVSRLRRESQDGPPRRHASGHHPAQAPRGRTQSRRDRVRQHARGHSS